LRVEVVYALAHAQDIVALELPEGAVARDAIAASGVLARHGLAAARLHLGMFGKRIAPEQQLRAGDRVEILRTLAAAPNDARRARARRHSSRA
jgi:uncharacterized protein